MPTTLLVGSGVSMVTLILSSKTFFTLFYETILKNDNSSSFENVSISEEQTELLSQKLQRFHSSSKIDSKAMLVIGIVRMSCRCSRRRHAAEYRDRYLYIIWFYGNKRIRYDQR